MFSLSSEEVHLTSFIFANSPLQIPIQAYTFGHLGPRVLILGGVHGDEIEGVIASQGLLAKFLQNYSYKLQITLIPMFNIEGVLLKQRMNSRDVDLNRNLPTKDWSPEIKSPRYNPGPYPNSEPENQALVHWIEKEKPELILSLHSWNPVLNINGNCLKVAEVLSKWTGYHIDTDIGYPTPGSLGTYAGIERSSPVLTYEIERGLDSVSILKKHVPAILDALKVLET